MTGSSLPPTLMLTGTVVVLRPFKASDVPAIVAACRDPATYRYMPDLPRDYTEADATEWLASLEPARAAGDRMAFAIAAPKTDGLLGALIANISVTHLTAALAYWLVPSARGQGRMTEAVRLVCSWLFDGQGLARVELETDPANLPSQHVAERCGFQKEGYLRSHLRDPDTGARLDSIVWGLLAGELRLDRPCPAQMSNRRLSSASRRRSINTATG